MINKPIEEITVEDLEGLITDEVGEGKMLEFKRELHIDTSGEKKEFLWDVSSFANASGGHLIFGIKEEDSKAKEIVGIDVSEEDKLLRRVENILRTSIDPRIPGIQLRLIEKPSEWKVFVIHVPKSWNSPHMVSVSKSRFYSRNSKEKFPMDVTEIRSAFALSQELPERIRRFRDGRLAKIIADETPMPVASGPRLILHVLPLLSFSVGVNFDVNEIYKCSRPLCMFGKPGGMDRFNIDGYLSYIEAGPKYGYAQIFRTGTIEAVTTKHFSNTDKHKIINSSGFELDCIRTLERYIQILKQLVIKPPVLIFLSMTGVLGYIIVRLQKKLDRFFKN